MALLGVFSATPVGASELAQMGAAEVEERVEASSLAVACLSALLLQALLSPTPGNPLASAYVLKHRERQPGLTAIKFVRFASRGRAIETTLAGVAGVSSASSGH